MWILGISCHYHDAAAALIKDGKLVAAVEEERFTRKKHDFNFPLNSIQFCLETAGISADEIDRVVFYEKPFVKFERVLSTAMAGGIMTWRMFQESMISWMTEKLWLKGLIRNKLHLSDPNRIMFSEHHLSHAASAYYSSPFDEAAVLTADAVGEWTTASIGVGKGNELNLIEELHFPHSVGLLYSAFTAFLGFQVSEGEYKVMGMSAYGKPKYVNEIYKVVRVENDGSIRLNMKYFAFQKSSDRMFSSQFVDLFGRPRTQEQSETLDPYYADLAASIQKVTEEILVKMARHVKKITGQRYLCMAGGVALNSLANYRILKESGFEDIYIQPAAGDAGGSLGAALWAYHHVEGHPRNFVMDHAYWGPEITESELDVFLNNNGIHFYKCRSQDEIVERAVDALSLGKVIGWHQGKMEWGPRALGNRSILADPKRSDMKDIVNSKIKFREPFRPFAPSVISEKATDYFSLEEGNQLYPARFMLYVTPVKEDKRDILPATTHDDGTARVQVVNKETNPLYHKLIHSFGQQSGHPVLLNTSFNLRGEPVVNRPEEAYSTFQRSELDALVMGPYWCDKKV